MGFGGALSLTLIIFFILIPVPSGGETALSGEKESKMKITTPAFGHNGNIPPKFTCDGENVNPSLNLEGVPKEAKSLALIVDDPDAPSGMFVHWVVWNIPPDTTEIKENSVPKGASQGVTDYRIHDYKGPCPPPGTHRYFFKLYALDAVLGISDNSKKTDLEKAMKGRIIAQSEIIGLYKRK